MDSESQRIVRELHDEIGQRLMLLQLDLCHLVRDVEQDPARLLPGRVSALQRHLDEVGACLRRVLGRHAPSARDTDLGSAAQDLVVAFSQRLGIECRLETRIPADLAIGDAVACGVYRILQESLSNVVRHVPVHHVEVVLSLDGESLLVSVTDEGCSFPARAVPSASSFGLQGMRERAIGLGGELWVEPGAPSGVRITARLPLRPPPQQTLLPTGQGGVA